MQDHDNEANTSRSLLASAKRVLHQMFGADGALETELASLQKRPFGIQQRKAELETKMKARGVYLKRLGNFQPLVGTEFQCPNCWMCDEVTAGLDVTNVRRSWSGTYAELHCWRCRQDFLV